jgi:alanine racemase
VTVIAPEVRCRGFDRLDGVLRTEAVVDLAAIRANVATLRAGTSAEVMAVVKADGYGHGLVQSARAALAGGATWLGTATIDEALALRAAGFAEPVLAWLWTPGEDAAVQHAVADGIDVSVSSGWQLDAVRAAATATGRTARVHLKIDTGLSRNGSYVTDWPELVAAAAKAQAAGEVEAYGVWSHFVYADQPGHPTIARQIAAFGDALEVAERAGVHPTARHLANSAATLSLPQAHFDLVRPGIAVYGLSPMPGSGNGPLIPAMTLRAALASVKRVAAGEGVSYAHAYTTTRESTLALVPLGYADGVPRHASNVGPVSINGARFTVSGRVCMDQFVVDVGDHPVAAGDAAVLFGTGRDGEPTAHDWAEAIGTIHYEIVTRVGVRVPRVYVGES